MLTTRIDFQTLTSLRVAEAQALLAAGLWDGAYYLAGYAAECALKASVIRMLNSTDIYPDRKFSDNCYRHDLELLLRIAGLEVEMSLSGQVENSWNTIKDWTEQTRYETGRSESAARAMLAALTDAGRGVLPWIQARW